MACYEVWSENDCHVVIDAETPSEARQIALKRFREASQDESLLSTENIGEIQFYN